MLSDKQRLFIARHLLCGVPGLEEKMVSQSKGTLWPDAVDWLNSDDPTPEQKIIGLVALDVWNGSGNTVIGQAISKLDRKTFKRMADVLQALI